MQGRLKSLATSFYNSLQRAGKPARAPEFSSWAWLRQIELESGLALTSRLKDDYLALNLPVVSHSSRPLIRSARRRVAAEFAIIG